MEVLILQIFVTFVLGFGAVLFFVSTLRRHEHEHHERLALLPIEEETRR
jgi:hypothetical protein